MRHHVIIDGGIPTTAEKSQSRSTLRQSIFEYFCFYSIGFLMSVDVCVTSMQ